MKRLRSRVNSSFFNSYSPARLVLVLSLMTFGFALTPPVLVQGPLISQTTTSVSSNWSGYVITGAKHSVTDVEGSWKVPAVIRNCPSKNEYSSFWVGIDGFNSGTVEQTGTASDCQNGSPTYFAWFEFYPNAPRIIGSITVSPGDVIFAKVSFSGSVFTATIRDVSTGKSFSKVFAMKAARSSAEFIVEAPSSGKILPLADFGRVNFGSKDTGVGGTCIATIGGATGSIASFGSRVQEIKMTGSTGTKAQPSSLSSGGGSFSVTWESSGP